MKYLWYAAAWIAIIWLTNTAVGYFEAHEAAGLGFTPRLYAVFFGCMALGALVVAVVASYRGRRPWLWFLLGLPMPGLALLVLVLKRNLIA